MYIYIHTHTHTLICVIWIQGKIIRDAEAQSTRSRQGAEDSRRGGHRHVCIVVYVYTCIHTKQIKELKTAKEVHTRMCVYDFYYVYVCLI